MTEGLFLVTTLFVAYVVYVILNEKKASTVASSKKPAPVATAPAPAPSPSSPELNTVLKEAAQPVEAVAKPAAVKAAAKPAAVKKTTAPAPKAKTESEPKTIKGSGLKDPATGEVTTTYANYRFTKRWIKEALVAEKLVDKIYKSDEITPEVETKIKAGIIKLEGMKKYKP